MYLCLRCGGVGGEWAWDMDQCLEVWGGDMVVLVMSLDYLIIWIIGLFESRFNWT